MNWKPNPAVGRGGRGLLRISSDRDDRRIFGGMKFSIPGFFGQESLARILPIKFLSRDFLGYSKQSELRRLLVVCSCPGSVVRRIFQKVIPNLFSNWKVLVQGFYLGFVGALGMFLSLDLAPFDHPRHFRIRAFQFCFTTPLHQSRDLSRFSGLGHVQCNEGYEVARRNLGSLI